MKSRKEIRDNAKLDVNLKDIPARDNGGSYIASSGQQAILSEYHELRELDSQIEELKEKRFKYLEEITTLGSVHMQLDKNDSSEVTHLKARLADLNEELELKLKESSALRRSFEKRGAIIPDFSNEAREQRTPVKKRKRIEWRKLIRKVMFFLAVEGFLIIIQFASLRDHLSLLEVIYRSVAVLAIAVLIVHVHRRNQEVPGKINLVFILFSIVMFMTSIALPPVLYQQANREALPAVEDPFDLSGNTLETEVEGTGWMAEFYLENTWIPAFLCVVFYLYVIYGHSLLPSWRSVKEGSSTMEEDWEGEYAPLRSVDSRIATIKKEKQALESELLEVESRPTDMTIVLRHLEGLMKASEESEEAIKKLRVKFKEVMANIQNQLHLYQVEFLDYFHDEDELVREVITAPVWPSHSDIINYYKTYNL